MPSRNVRKNRKRIIEILKEEKNKNKKEYSLKIKEREFKKNLLTRYSISTLVPIDELDVWREGDWTCLRKKNGDISYIESYPELDIRAESGTIKIKGSIVIG